MRSEPDAPMYHDRTSIDELEGTYPEAECQKTHGYVFDHTLVSIHVRIAQLPADVPSLRKLEIWDLQCLVDRQLRRAADTQSNHLVREQGQESSATINQ